MRSGGEAYIGIDGIILFMQYIPIGYTVYGINQGMMGKSSMKEKGIGEIDELLWCAFFYYL